MQQQPQTETGPNGGAIRVRGRNVEGQAVQLSVVKKIIDELVGMFIQSQEAATTLSETIKVVSEQSGVMPSVLRKLVKARAGEKFDKAKQEVEQLSMVFEEIGG